MTDDIDEIEFLNKRCEQLRQALEQECAEVERLKAERDEALRYATNFLVSYVNKYFPHNPEWRPLPELIGVLTQLDNASTITGELKARAEAAEKRLNGCRQWLRANASAERNPEARAAFIEAHDAILAIIEDRS